MKTLGRWMCALVALMTLALGCGPATAQVPLSSGSITTRNLVPTGTCTSGGCVEIEVSNKGLVTVHVKNTYTASGGLSGQLTTNGTDWITLTESTTFKNKADGTTAATIASGATGIFEVSAVVGAQAFRVTAISGAVTGDAGIVIHSVGLSNGGGAGGGGGGAVTVADGADQAVGAKADAAAAADTSTASLIALIKRALQHLTTLNTSVNAANSQLPTAPGTVAESSVATSRLPTSEPDSLSLTPASVTSATTIFTQDLTGYESISVQVTSAGTSSTITYEASEDATTWVSVAGVTIGPNSATGNITTSTAAGAWKFPKFLKHFRARVSTYGSGTITALATLHKAPFQAFTPVGATGLVVAGSVAHDIPISGNPVRIGCRALTANYTAVATGDTADLPCTTVGGLIVYPWSIPDGTWQYASAADVTDTTSTEMKAAVASARNYTNGCVFSNTDATVGTYVNILSASTVIGVVYVGAQVASTAGLNSLSVQFTPPLRGAVNEAINFQAVTTSAQLRVACQGFTSAH